MKKFFPDFDRPLEAPDTTCRSPAYFQGRGYPSGRSGTWLPGKGIDTGNPYRPNPRRRMPKYRPGHGKWRKPLRIPASPKRPGFLPGRTGIPSIRPPGAPPVNMPKYIPGFVRALPGRLLDPFELLQQPLADLLDDAIAGQDAAQEHWMYSGAGDFAICEWDQCVYDAANGFTAYSDSSGSTTPGCNRARSIHWNNQPAPYVGFYFYSDGCSSTGWGFYSEWVLYTDGPIDEDTFVWPELVPARPARPATLPAPLTMPAPWMDPLVPPGVALAPSAPPVLLVPDRALPEAGPGGEWSSGGNAPPSTGGEDSRPPVQPGRPPVTPLPSRPPAGTREKKRTNPLIPVLFKVWDAATEAQDAVDAVFGALPKRVRDDYHGRGLVDKAGYVFDHIDDVDIPTAIGNLIRNEAEDRAVGKMLGIADRAGVGMGLSGVGYLKR